MKRATRKSSIIPTPCDVQATTTTVGNFSTRFSMPSFVKRVEKLSENQRSAIHKMGFGNLLEIPNQTLNKSLLAELMYRWNSDKRAFMLECGEISITLRDVALILGLRVVGHQVLLNEDEPFLDLEEDFGASLPQRKIAISALETKLDVFDGMGSDDFLRTFLLYLFGTFLFSTTNGKVDSRYLSFLKNLDGVGQFAWGAAVLDDLFMWLSKRKDMNVQYVGGCLIFLQIWCYEHIDIARPSLLNNHLTFPRACRWENGKSHQRQHMTAKFKELQDHQIIWKLHPSSEEIEIDIVKELLDEENQKKELADSRNSPNKASIVVKDGLRSVSQVFESIALEVKIEPKMDTANEAHRVQELITEQPVSQVLDQIAAKVKIEPEMHNVSEAHGVPEPNLEPPMAITTKYPSTSNYASETFNEDDLRTRNKMLEEENMELKEELEKQRCEIMLLKTQLQSISLLEERNEELKKEVDRLRTENENLGSSSNDLVVRLERIILEGGF